MKFLFSLLLLAGNAIGATYYVSPSGNNSNVGSSGSPWLTIQKAGTTMVVGDTVNIRPGTYAERITPANSGTFGNLITYQAVDGSDNPITVPTSSAVHCYGFVINKSFLRFIGIASTANSSVPSFSGVFEVNKGLDTVHFLNCWIHDYDPLATVNPKVYGIHALYASNAIVATANVIISNCWFQNTSYIMVGANWSNYTICRSHFEFGNTHDCIHAFGTHQRIYENTMTNIGTNPLVADHTDIIQTFGDEETQSDDLIFERNMVLNSNAQLCQLEQKGRANIRDWTFRNNIFANVLLGGNVDLEDAKFYNNLYYKCTTSTAGPILLNCNFKGCATNAQVFNNIFFECGTPPATTQRGWYHPENFNFGYVADYNFACGPNGAAKDPYYKTASHEVHGFSGGDPLFVDPDNYDFHLQAGSPLIGAGIPISTFTNDFSGFTRSDTWDIGPYQSNPLALIPAGTFLMGDSYGEEDSDALPVHVANTSAFYIAQFETTNRKVRDVWQWALDRGLIFTPNNRLIKVTAAPQPVIFDVHWDDYGTNSTRYWSGITLTNSVFGLVAGREDQPCIDISWYGAAAYCNFRSQIDGLQECFNWTTYVCDFTKTGYRLPTEAEWEKAARGGLTSNHYPWPSPGLSYTAWISTNMANYTPPALPHPFNMKIVGYFNGSQYGGGFTNMANGYGLYDMAGNAQEWCYDRYQSDYYNQPGALVLDTSGPTDSALTTRVSRGGSFDLGEKGCLVAARENWPDQTANGASWYNGFRVAKSISTAPPISGPSPSAEHFERTASRRRATR